MSISNRFNFSPDQIAELNFEYVYSVGYLESFHPGIRRLRGGFESALSSGNTNMGFLCAAQSIMLSIISGDKKLFLLLQEVDYYLHLLKTYENQITRTFLLIFRKTVSTLIDREETTSIESDDSPGTQGDTTPKIVLDMIYVNGTIQNFWLGYSERCCHFAKKCFVSLLKPGREYRLVVMFYHGLNLLDMLKKKSNPPRRKEAREIIESLEVTVSYADSNFRNKLNLLQAELYGLDCRHSQAVAAYDAAIASAENHNFVHEQGLACEKAGFYFRKIEDHRNTLKYFDQARVCYNEWGSRVKVEMMEKEINALNALFQVRSTCIR